MIGEFSKIDFVESNCQTHATLTAARGIFRFYRTTGEKQYLDMAENIFQRYCDKGMTANFANFNWFGKPFWTEPCAIVDSLLLAVQLFHETSKYLYAQLANRIYINAFRRAQRPNGGAGCDSCLCESEKELKVLMYEAFFCCTMRYAEGLLCVYENTLFEENGKKFLLFHEQCSDEKTVVNIAKSNNEKHFSVEGDGVVKIYVPEFSKCDRKVVDGFLSAFQGEEVTLTDIKSTKKLSGLKVDMCGDEVLLKDEEGEAGNWQNCLSMTEEEAGKKVWRI